MSEEKFGKDCFGNKHQFSGGWYLSISDDVGESATISDPNEARRLAAWLLVQAEWMEGD